MHRLIKIVLMLIVAVHYEAVAVAVEPPEWAVVECKGLKALSEVVYYWIDRQAPDGSFGFGLDDDCEFYTGWPILVYVADDQRVLEALRKNLDWVWYNDEVQDGYQAQVGDAEHSSEVTSYTQPLLSHADYGNPVLIERMMETSKNMERWTAINKAGHRHFRGHWLGSQGMRDYSYFGADATIVARATIPMMHLLLYNRDPYLARICTEWGRAWVDHAKESKWNKPYGLLPAEVVFDTDEAGGFTRQWWSSASSGYDIYKSPWYMNRLHQMLLVDYMITGDTDFLIPMQETLKFFAQATPENTPTGVMWPEWYTDRVSPPTYGRTPEQMPLIWQDYKGRIGSYFPAFYLYATGDTQFDSLWGISSSTITPQAARASARGAGQSAIDGAKAALEAAKTINIHNSVDNYRANISVGGFPALYHGGNNWVDLPRPACRWLKGNYELAVVLLEHSATQFKALCCNVGASKREFGVQLFELKPGTYRMTLGIDTSANNRPDKIVREQTIKVEQGTILPLDLERGHEYIIELEQIAAGIAWSDRADVAICDRDLYAVPAAPTPGTAAVLKTRVHNIGTQDARNVGVRAVEIPSGKLIGEQTIDLLAAPAKLVPSWVMVEMPWTVGADAEGVRVVVDQGHFVEEIYEGNNTAEIRLAEMPDGPPRKRKIFIPSWYEMQKLGPVTTYTAPYVKNIKIDGKLDDAEWGKVEKHSARIDMDGRKTEKETILRIAYGDEAIYIAVECPEPDMDLLHENATRRDAYEVFGDDGVEIFIDTNLDRTTYLQFAFTVGMMQAEGQYYNFSIFNEPWESVVHKGKDFWSAEARIPYTTLGAIARPGQTWGMNIYRNVKTFPVPKTEEDRQKGWKTGEQHLFSPTHDYHEPSRFAEVTFGPKP